MKRILWVGAALLGAAAWVVSGPVDALAWTDCRDTECTLGIHCTPLCPPCSGSPGDPGVCWWIE